MPITLGGKAVVATNKQAAGAESFLAWRERDTSVRQDWLATLETHSAVLTDVQAEKWGAIVSRHANNCFIALCNAARAARRRETLRTKLADPALRESPHRPAAVKEEREVAGWVSHWLVEVARDEMWATTAWRDMSARQRVDTGAANAWQADATRPDLCMVALNVWRVEWPPGFDPLDEVRGFQGFPGVNEWLLRAGRLPDAKQELEDMRQWLDRISAIEVPE